MKLKIKAHTNSSKQEIRKVNDNEYEIWIKEKAEDNKANMTIAKLLKKYFKKDVKIISGFSSRNKVIEIK